MADIDKGLPNTRKQVELPSEEQMDVSVEEEITEKEYHGKVEHVIPQVGYITQILQPPINYLIIAVIIAVMVVRHFAGKESSEWKFWKEQEKKKIEFQYTKDDSSEDSELEDNQLDNIKDEHSDSEYTKTSEKDGFEDEDKKEF